MSGKCIISGVDLGAGTEAILSYSASFSRVSGAELRLIYVLDYLLTPPAYLAPYIDEERKREESALSVWQAALEQQGLQTSKSVMIGRLHESFMTAIREFSPEMIVIGHRSHALRSSSSENLIRSLAIPMLVVRGKRSISSSIGSVDIKKILCAVDLPENSRKAFSAACRYSGLFGAELHLLHVMPSHVLNKAFSGRIHPDRCQIDRFEKDLKVLADSAISDMLKAADTAVGYGIVKGDPANEICSYAENNEYDLIVMGARGLSFIESVIIGSTTEGVLKSSPCPVLVVH